MQTVVSGGRLHVDNSSASVMFTLALSLSSRFSVLLWTETSYATLLSRLSILWEVTEGSAPVQSEGAKSSFSKNTASFAPTTRSKYVYFLSGSPRQGGAVHSTSTAAPERALVATRSFGKSAF